MPRLADDNGLGPGLPAMCVDSREVTSAGPVGSVLLPCAGDLLRRYEAINAVDRLVLLLGRKVDPWNC